MRAPAIPHNLRTRLLMLPALPVFLWAVVVVLTMVQGQDVEKTFERYAQEDMRVYREVSDLHTHLTAGHVRLYTLLEQGSKERSYSTEQVFTSMSEQVDLLDKITTHLTAESLANPLPDKLIKLQRAALLPAIQNYRLEVVSSMRTASASLDIAYQEMQGVGEEFLQLNSQFIVFLQKLEEKSQTDFALLQQSTWEKNATIASVATFTAILVLLVCISLYRRLSGGFQELLSMVRAMQAGELNQNDYHFSNDEMGYLTKRFFLMGTALDDMRKNLSDRVEERTAELQEVTRHLTLEIEKSQVMSAQLRNQAETDELTGLFNRRYFMQAFEREWSRDQRHGNQLALLMIDIDFFKQVNDQYGHQVGDLCLQVVSSVLKGCAQRQSDLIARFGGEEFSVMLPETGLEEAQSIAESMLLSVSEIELPPVTNERKITVSIGIGMLDSQYKSSEAIFKAVDIALYQAKDAGRNCVMLAKSAVVNPEDKTPLF